MTKKMPLIGLGTWKLNGAECTRTIKKAIDIGYRHIDTAHVYNNHTDIAKGIKEIDRSELYITSKIDPSQLKSDGKGIEDAIKTILKELDTDYLDLILLHAPDRRLPMNKIVEDMWKAKENRMVHDVGVSNFTIHHLQDLFDAGLKTSYNQVEYHPYLVQKKLLDFCNLNEVQLISYRSFGKGALLDDPDLLTLGKKYNKTSAQIILRWLYQQEIPSIPKAKDEDHLNENFDILDFDMITAEMDLISKLNRNERYATSERFDFNY
ncbi:MAG: aldo/keto reductase [Parachlamydiales bacterium]|nr:aldo/keto reductase [Parachlamydiales bacterium]